MVPCCPDEVKSELFPKRCWAIGDKEFSFSAFEWDPDKRIMLYGGGGFPYGEIAQKPKALEGNPTRLYSTDELEEIFANRNIEIIRAFSNYNGREASGKYLQLMVYSKKQVQSDTVPG